MGIIIGIVGLEDKGQLMKLIANGFSDMVSVNLVIAMARATSVIMAATGLGTWLVEVLRHRAQPVRRFRGCVCSA